MTVLPEGFRYFEDVISADEERELVGEIGRLTLAPVVMRGYTAKRRTAHFGVVYGYDAWAVTPGPPIPPFLLGLRDRVTSAAGLEAEPFSEALVTEYIPGATIGWHRDARMFGPTVVGLSLGARCRMRFRRGYERGADATERADIVLEPRSVYVLSGPARSEWQHSIPAVDAVRYSITYRSVRARGARRR